MTFYPRKALIAALCIFLPLCTPATAQAVGSSTTASGPMVKVSGQGEVSIAPDMAQISLGVMEEAATAAAATTQMSDGMRAVMEQISKAGIAARDIQTSGLRLDVTRVYNNDTGEARVTGYVASTNVTIIVRDLDTLGTVLDAVVRDGANQISGLAFDIQNRKPYLIAARRAAVTDAMEKADLYAQAAGAKLGGVRLIDDSRGGNNAPAPMMRMAMEDSSAVPVAQGEITISAEVLMIFDLD